MHIPITRIELLQGLVQAGEEAELLTSKHHKPTKMEKLPNYLERQQLKAIITKYTPLHAMQTNKKCGWIINMVAKANLKPNSCLWEYFT